MHACHAVTLAQLLSVRDSEPVDAGALRHIEQCGHCAHELARLRELKSSLRGLPEFEAPPYDAFALHARLRAARSYRFAGVAAAGAGALALMFAVGFGGRQPPLATAAIDSPTEMALVDNLTDSPNVGALVIRSQELEARLRGLPQRPRVERASTSTAIDSLQNRIQWVDYQLSLGSDVGMTDKQAARLWHDRVQLMDSLVKVRYAEMQRAAYFVSTSGSAL